MHDAEAIGVVLVSRLTSCLIGILLCSNIKWGFINFNIILRVNSRYLVSSEPHAKTR